MEVQMHGEICCNCGMPFEITEEFYKRLKECHNTFYCPQGHSQFYPAKSAIELEREKSWRLNQEKIQLEARRVALELENAELEKQLARRKKAKTRARSAR